MTKGELLKEFENIVGEFLKTHAGVLNQNVRWEEMSQGMLFGQAYISSNDFVLILLRAFRNTDARIIDSGVWQPFPNFSFPLNPPQGKLYPEETVDWDVELGRN